MSTESPLSKTKTVEPEGRPVEDQKNTDNKDNANPKKFKRLSAEERLKLLEEEQAKKVIIERGLTGKVKWYSVRSHYGFIAPNGKQHDVFVHQSAITKSRIIKFYLRTLADGEEVTFDIVRGQKGDEAANVTGPNGANVIGSRYFLAQLRRRRQQQPKNDEGDENPKKAQKKEVTEDGKGDTVAKPKRRRIRRNRRRRFSSKNKSEDSGTEGEKAEAKSNIGKDEKVKPQKDKDLLDKSGDEKAAGRRRRKNTEGDSSCKDVSSKKEAEGKKESRKSTSSEKAVVTPKKGIEEKVDEAEDEKKPAIKA